MIFFISRGGFLLEIIELGRVKNQMGCRILFCSELFTETNELLIKS